MVEASLAARSLFRFYSRRVKETESKLVPLELARSPFFLAVYLAVKVVSCTMVRAIPILGNLPIWISEIERVQSQEGGFLEERPKQLLRRLRRVEGNLLSAIVAMMRKTNFLHGQTPERSATRNGNAAQSYANRR